MLFTASRAISLLLALALVAGVIASAVLAFLDEVGTLARLGAVALVAVGGLIPIGRQVARDLTPSPWETFVTCGRRATRARAETLPWSVFGLVPGDTLFNVRTVLGGPEDKVYKHVSDRTGDGDRRVWSRPHFTFSADVRREVVTALTVSIKPEESRRLRIAVPRGVLLGTATVSDMQQEAGHRAPDLSVHDYYEGYESLAMFWATGPEGTLRLELSITKAPGATGSVPIAEMPIGACTLSDRPEPASPKRSWRGWPPLDAGVQRR